MKIVSSEKLWEENIDKRFRRIPYLIFLITLGSAFFLYALWLFFLRIFVAGHWWVLPLSGLIVHSWMILLVHEGAHKNLTGSELDRLILNLASSMVFLPFYGEPFRKVHLYHHANTNKSDDPLWPEWKVYMFGKYRRVYVLLEFLPLVVNLLALVRAPFLKRDILKSESSNLLGNVQKKRFYGYLFLSFILSGTYFYLLKPDLVFLIGTFFFANFWGCLRHWCEHTGFSNTLESNTFSFPLGFGIGNHEVHHRNPSLSWLSLALGLGKREKTISIRKSFVGLWSDPAYIHYSSEHEETQNFSK